MQVAGCRLAFAQRGAGEEPEPHVADGDEDLVRARVRIRARVRVRARVRARLRVRARVRARARVRVGVRWR